MVNALKRKRIGALLFFSILAAVFVWFSPVIIAKSSYRDAVLNSIANAPEYQLSSSNASFGWLTPLVIDDLVIAKRDQSITLRIQKLTSSKSWFALWLSSPDLGVFSVDRPELEVVAGGAEMAAEGSHQPSSSLPTLTAVVSNAHVVVFHENSHQPEIDLDNIDLTIEMENNDSVDFLSMGAIQVFDRLELTPEVCNQGVQLVVPSLANEVNIQGSVSFELTRFRLPLGTDSDEFRNRFEAEGVLQLHRFSAGINNETTKRLAMMFAEILELGEVPDDWRLTDGATLNFQVRDGRVVHDGLAMLLPDVAPGFSIRSSGTVSLDEQVELSVSANLPTELLGESGLAKKVSQTPIEIRIVGSLEETRALLPADPKWVFALSDDLLSESLSSEEQDLAEDLIKFIAELHAESGEQAPQLPPNLMARIQQIPAGN